MHTHVAKMLYLSKRVRPECLTAVSFKSARSIVLRVRENMAVSAYIDAAYGVHQESGKSHTGWSRRSVIRKVE